MKSEAALSLVKAELSKALNKHSAMKSAHDGWAVIYEEVDELWDEVRVKQSQHSKQRMREEATQIAAMALRFMVDLT